MPLYIFVARPPWQRVALLAGGAGLALAGIAVGLAFPAQAQETLAQARMLLAQMEERGWVRREADPRDARA